MIKNQFYLDSVTGREAYPRQYQRTTFYLSTGDTQKDRMRGRSQILMLNIFDIQNAR